MRPGSGSPDSGLVHLPHAGGLHTAPCRARQVPGGGTDGRLAQSFRVVPLDVCALEPGSVASAPLNNYRM